MLRGTLSERLQNLSKILLSELTLEVCERLGDQLHPVDRVFRVLRPLRDRRVRLLLARSLLWRQLLPSTDRRVRPPDGFRELLWRIGLESELHPSELDLPPALAHGRLLPGFD